MRVAIDGVSAEVGCILRKDGCGPATKRLPKSKLHLSVFCRPSSLETETERMKNTIYIAG